MVVVGEEDLVAVVSAEVTPVEVEAEVWAGASAVGFHTFPTEARASQAGWVCREQGRTSFRDKTGESIALLLRASPAIVARCLQPRVRRQHLRNAD